MLNRLLIASALLLFPFLVSAQTPVVCGGPGPTDPVLHLNSSYSLPEVSSGAETATFSCAGVAITPVTGSRNIFDGGQLSDHISWGTSGSGSTLQTVITFASFADDPGVPESSEGPRVFFGTFTHGGITIPIKFTARSNNDPGISGSDTLSVSAVTPEPATMLLFGTGLLVVGAILRRRTVAA